LFAILIKSRRGIASLISCVSLQRRHSISHLRRKPTQVVPAPEDVGLPPSGHDQGEVGGEATATVDRLPEFSFLVERLCMFHLLAIVVFVPALAIGTPFAKTMSNVLIGLTFVLPTTIMVWKAGRSTHTKWFWGEAAVIIVSVAIFVIQYVYIFGFVMLKAVSRCFAYFVFALPITQALPRVLCRGLPAREETRIVLLFLAANGQVLIYLVGM
jgi:hypothetical protein